MKRRNTMDVLDAPAAGVAYAAAAPLPSAPVSFAPRELAPADASPAVTTHSTGSRTWKKWARDIAIGVALIIAVPTTFVRTAFHPMPFTSLLDEKRVGGVESLRPLRLPTDAAISPMAAGEAFARVTQLSNNVGYRLRFEREAKEQLKTLVLPESTVLVAVRDPKRLNLFDPAKLIHAAATGLSAKDAAWLEQAAALQIWRDVDLVARAPRVDVLGGRFELPYGADATPWGMPIMRATHWRQLVAFGVARAGSHVHRKEWAAAEQDLRTVVSLGFVLVDNGATIIEALFGRIAISAGRAGLAQLAAERGDKALAALAVEPKEPPQKTYVKREPLPPIDREQALATLIDPSVPRSVRMERHFLAHYLQCNSTRELLFGMSDDMRATLDESRRQLARFPSEDALLRRHEAVFESLPSFVGARSGGMLLMGAATAASAITGNPRIAACAAPLVNW
jgi:hypothetical protein